MWGWILSRVYAILLVSPLSLLPRTKSESRGGWRTRGSFWHQPSASTQNTLATASLRTHLSSQRDRGSLRLLKIELSIFDKMLLFLFDGSACFLPPTPTTLTFPAFLSAINLVHSWLFHTLLSTSLGKPSVCCQDGWMGQAEKAQLWEGRSKSSCEKNICPGQPEFYLIPMEGTGAAAGGLSLHGVPQGQSGLGETAPACTRPMGLSACQKL